MTITPEELAVLMQEVEVADPIDFADLPFDEQELRGLKQIINQLGEVFEAVRDDKKRALEHSYQETTLESLLQPLKKMDMAGFDTDFRLEVDVFNPVLRNFLDNRAALQDEINRRADVLDRVGRRGERRILRRRRIHCRGPRGAPVAAYVHKVDVVALARDVFHP